MRRITVALSALGMMMFGAGSAQAATLTSSNGIISYVADQGERNDLVVGTGTLLGLPVYTFTDNDANPIKIGGGYCQLINGVGMCRQDLVSSFVLDVRDRDDTVEIATSGADGMAPPAIPSTIIGGRGVDVLEGGNGPDLLKGNDGRDDLRGRQGADVYLGGRGNDTLQTLDGEPDTSISCGEGVRDLLRGDTVDPKPKSCELGGLDPGKRF